MARDPQDNLARLCLGMTLARTDEKERGVHDQLESLAADGFYGMFWDPTGQLRSSIKSSLEQKIPELIASAQHIGILIDREIDLARRDEINLR